MNIHRCPAEGDKVSQTKGKAHHGQAATTGVNQLLGFHLFYFFGDLLVTFREILKYSITTFCFLRTF